MLIWSVCMVAAVTAAVTYDSSTLPPHPRATIAALQRHTHTLPYTCKVDVHMCCPHTQGRDHIWFMAHDEGACYMPSDVYNASIVWTHWGRHGLDHVSSEWGGSMGA